MFTLILIFYFLLLYASKHFPFSYYLDENNSFKCQNNDQEMLISQMTNFAHSRKSEISIRKYIGYSNLDVFESYQFGFCDIDTCFDISNVFSKNMYHVSVNRNWLYLPNMFGNNPIDMTNVLTCTKTYESGSGPD